MQASIAFINRTVQLHNLEQSDPNSEEAKIAREQFEARRAGLLLRIENVITSLKRGRAVKQYRSIHPPNIAQPLRQLPGRTPRAPAARHSPDSLELAGPF